MTRKIMASLLVIAVTAMLIGLGTFAYFSDTETSTDNTFTAGTLTLQVDDVEQTVTAGWGDVDTDGLTFTVINVAPGSAGNDVWTVRNVGTIAGVLSLVVNNLEEVAGVDENADLAGALDVVLSVNGQTVYEGTLAEMPGTYTEDVEGNALPTLVNGEEVNVVLYWSIDGPDVGNEIQGDSVSFDITFTLDQVQPQP